VTWLDAINELPLENMLAVGLAQQTNGNVFFLNCSNIH